MIMCLKKTGFMRSGRFGFRILLAGVLMASIAAIAPASPSASAEARIVTWPAPEGEPLSADYRVEVNGRPVDVYLAKTEFNDGKYGFASFDFSGEVNVRVTSPLSLEKAEILPQSSGIELVLRTAQALEFTARRPFKISIERDGENSPLLLFGNPLEENPPKAGDPGVVYFGPGIHKPGKISLGDGQTLYLAGGAVVKGGVEAKGENIAILGRGILDGSDYPHLDGPMIFMVHFEKCRNVAVRDVILRGSWSFTIAPCGCDNVTIDNVKICGSRVLNDDGIDIINSRDVAIRDCFIRTQDDCIAIKGLKGYEDRSCERITVTGCSFWTDIANIFRIGYESDAEAMRDITARDVDVLHFVDTRPVEHYWTKCVFCIQPSNNMPMEDLVFEDFRINAAGGRNVLVKILPMICGGWSLPDADKAGDFIDTKYQEPGRHVKNCRFKNIVLSGKAGGRPGMIYVSGVDAGHTVEGVTFENVVRLGEPAYADSPEVSIGPYATKIEFLPAPAVRARTVQAPRWFKGNLHTHTTMSDGDSSPESVIRWYKDHGYDFLAITDHNTLTPPDEYAALQDKRFLLIPAMEVSDRFGDAPLHVLALGLRDPGLKPAGGGDVSGTLQNDVKAALAAEAVPVLCHPNFEWAFGADELFRIQECDFFEVLNVHPAVDSAGGIEVPGTEEMWDSILSRGKRMFGIGTDDMHILSKYAGRSWIMVRAAELSWPAIWTAMERGNFYTSTGVVLDDIRVKGSRISLSIRAKEGQGYTTFFIGSSGRVLKTDASLSPSYKAPKTELYIRAKVIDARGRVALTQPIFFSEKPE